MSDKALRQIQVNLDNSIKRNEDLQKESLNKDIKINELNSELSILKSDFSLLEDSLSSEKSRFSNLDKEFSLLKVEIDEKNLKLKEMVSSAHIEEIKHEYRSLLSMLDSDTVKDAKETIFNIKSDLEKIKNDLSECRQKNKVFVSGLRELVDSVNNKCNENIEELVDEDS